MAINNDIKITGLQALERIRGTKGGWNAFRTMTGASNPGVGSFTIQGAGIAPDSGTLRFRSQNPKTKIELNIVNIKQLPITSDINNQTIAGTTDAYNAVVSDMRARSIGSSFGDLDAAWDAAYNCVDTTFEDLVTDTLINDESEWTWKNIFDALGVEINNADNLPSYNPRNLIFDNVPKYAVIDNLAEACWMVVGYNYFGESQRDVDKLVLYNPGQISAYNAEILEKAEKFGQINKRADAITFRNLS